MKKKKQRRESKYRTILKPSHKKFKLCYKNKEKKTKNGQVEIIFTRDQQKRAKMRSV